MTTTATALLARSLSAGLRVSLNDSRLVVRGLAALQPLVDEVKSHRAEIIALLVEAKKLFHETRDAGNVVFAIGTDRVSAATSIAGDLRERLRLAKVGIIAVLRAETPLDHRGRAGPAGTADAACD